MNTRSGSIGSVAGFYGKIPSTGDFVSRRVPQQTIFIWDNWLRTCLYEATLLSPAITAPAHGPQSIHLRRAATWNFILPPAVCGQTMIGIIAPSSDRVGRQFPFTIFRQWDLPAQQNICLEQLSGLYADYDSIIAYLTHRNPNIDQLEQRFATSDNRIPVIDDSATASSASTCNGDIFSVLNGDCENVQTAAPSERSPLPVPWSSLQISNVTMGCTSYWWCNQSGGGPMRAMTHSGGLNKTLFNALFSQTTLHARPTDWKK